MNEIQLKESIKDKIDKALRILYDNDYYLISNPSIKLDMLEKDLLHFV